MTANGTGSVLIQNFNAFGMVNSLQLKDVYLSYLDITSLIQDNDVYIAIKLTYPQTNQTFTFGSRQNDRFLIDASTILVHGGDGSDVYVVNKNSTDYLWINNEANDDVVDTLVIVDGTCRSLRAEIGSAENNYTDSSEYDVKLICEVTDTTTRTINVILENYLIDGRYRHLQIHWRDTKYVLLPHQWTNTAVTGQQKDIELAILFSFHEQWHQSALTLTSNDKRVLLNISNEANPLVAYRSQAKDVVLAQKYLDSDRSAFVVLQNFFVTGTVDVDPNWEELMIYVVENFDGEHEAMKTLGVDDIRLLIANTLFTDGPNDEAEFIKIYTVNMTEESVDDIIINHNNITSFNA